MGFRARSAKDVYRYAFRLDEDRDRSLGDGFGWTVVLLGDTGAASRDLLVRHGVELSIATAHRVRFVFFSGMSQEATTRTVLGTGTGTYAARSFLDRMRDSLGMPSWRHRPLDWEGRSWRELRPDAFLPFTDALGVDSHLRRGHQVWDSAVPGAEAARELAQRLGIGRHVPCLLVFTDIGAPRYHVLPIGDLPTEEVYRRVRHWVDSYYEINRETLARWSGVEERIQSLARMAQVSLETVRTWPAQRRDDWLALSMLGECARLAREDPDAALEQLSALCARHTVRWRIGQGLSALEHRVRDLEARERDARQLRETVRPLRDATDARHITDILHRLARQRPARVGAPSHEAINAASRLWSQTLHVPQSRQEELFRWWRSLQNPLFSRQRFARLRYAWRNFYEPQRREGESNADHARRDYEAFWTALSGCPLSAEAEVTTAHVLARLADHYGASAAAPAWSAATENVRRHVTEALRRARRGAPEWLLGLAPPVLLHECLYLGGINDKALHEAFLASSPRLVAAVRERAGAPERAARSDAEHLAQCLRHRDDVALALLQDAHRLETEPVSRAALSRQLETELTQILGGFRLKVAREGAETFGRRSGVAQLEDNLHVAEELSAALAEYDAAVRDVVYPHMDDPLVEALPAPPHLDGTVGLKDRRKPPSAETRLRRSFTDLRDNTREALSRQDRARSEGAAWAPDARLAEVLTEVLDPPRAAAVLAPWPGASARESVALAVRDGRAAELLGTLTPREQTRMLELARPADAPQPRLGPGEAVTTAVLLGVFGLPSASGTAEAPRVRVFISYAHEDDGGAHGERVREFWTLLRSVGIDARLDRPAAEQPQDWALWMHNEFRAADYVLVVASPAYKRRAEGTETDGTGKGVAWEARYLRNEVYSDRDGWHRRILKVVLPGGSQDDLPAYLGGHTVTHYAVDPIDAQGVEKLLRYLTRQPYEVAQPPGPVPYLPPRGA